MTENTNLNIELEINDETIDPEAPEESEETKMTDPFDPNKINIIPKQDSLSNLIGRLQNDEIDMNTEFQRHADLWDDTKMSRFIESILIRFPIPSFYFDASDENKWLIVDGLQRLSALRKFVIEKKLKLKNLEYLKDQNGKTYDDLSRLYIRRINECPVTLFILQPGTPEDVKYSIFRRINTGGLVLTNQEIRFAMAPNSLREFLKKIVKNDFFKRAVGDQSKRMMDQELALRFLAFYDMDYDIHKAKNITTFLDEMVTKMKKADSSELLRLEKAFFMAMQRCWDIFGEDAFEKKNSESENGRKRKNSTLFEIWSVALAKLSEIDFKKILENQDIVKQKHDSLMINDSEYFKAITFSTQKREHFRIRHNKIKELINEVLND